MSSRAMTPHVGISAYGEPARWGPWELPAALLPMSYPEAVAGAGGVPVLLAPLPGIEEAVSRLDALVLSGGGDIDPAAYGAGPHPLTERVSSRSSRTSCGASCASGSRPIRSRSARSAASRTSFLTRRQVSAFAPSGCARCTSAPAAARVSAAQ